MKERDRITPYSEGEEIAIRVDEILLGSTHLEMLDSDLAFLSIGNDSFFIEISSGELIVRHAGTWPGEGYSARRPV